MCLKTRNNNNSTAVVYASEMLLCLATLFDNANAGKCGRPLDESGRDFPRTESSPSPQPSPAGRGRIIVRRCDTPKDRSGTWVHTETAFEEIVQGFQIAASPEFRPWNLLI
jgi:hypothetical protein